MQYLTSAQTAALALNELVPGDLARLHPEQLLAQSGGAVDGVSANLTPEQLGGLLPAQIATVLPNLNPAQVPHITSVQLAGVPRRDAPCPVPAAAAGDHAAAVLRAQRRTPQRAGDQPARQPDRPAVRLAGRPPARRGRAAGRRARGRCARSRRPPDRSGVARALPPALQARIPPLPVGGGVPVAAGDAALGAPGPARPSRLAVGGSRGPRASGLAAPVRATQRIGPRVRARPGRRPWQRDRAGALARGALHAPGADDRGRGAQHARRAGPQLAPPLVREAPHNNWGTPLPGPTTGHRPCRTRIPTRSSTSSRTRRGS